jgi:hypothetical protein
MMEPVRTLAVCTTIYPGVEDFLPAWHASLAAQSDQHFDLWIGLDSVESGAVERIVGTSVKAHWVPADPGTTPAQVRQRVWSQIGALYDGVVLVDSDDLLHSSRVAAARAALQDCDLNGCALQLVDHHGRTLSMILGLPPNCAPTGVLPRNNLFGLSNSAYRSHLLQQCLPVPAESALVDWYLSTRAWLLGARLTFDPTVRMDYRQHGTNMARVRGPFNEAQVAQDTALVRKHFRIMQANPPVGYMAERFAELERTADDVELFHQRVTLDTDRLAQYVAALNVLAAPPLWWSCVAHPALASFWKAHTN